MDLLFEIFRLIGAVVIAISFIVFGFYFAKLAKAIRESNKEDNNEIKSLENKLDYINKSIGDEFHRVRLENQNSNKEIRHDVQKSLEDMSQRIDNMNKGNYEHREKMNEMLLSIRDKNAEQNEKQNRVLESSITKMQESNEKKLEEMRVTVDEKLTATLTTRLDSSFKTVSEQLENLYKSLGEMQTLSTGVTENVTALNRVLTNVKARGTWAEVQLEGILNQTIPNMFEKNVATVPNSLDRVEFAIRIPSSEKDGKDILLPVDSKFPMEDYVRLCDAADRADAEAVKQARKELENRVFDKVKDSETGEEKSSFTLTNAGENILVNEKAAKKYEYSGKVAGIDLRYMQIIIKKDNVFYIFTYTSTPDLYSRHDTEIETILKFFEFK